MTNEEIIIELLLLMFDVKHLVISERAAYDYVKELSLKYYKNKKEVK